MNANTTGGLPPGMVSALVISGLASETFARKLWVCGWCGANIPPGNRYFYFNRGVVEVRICCNCQSTAADQKEAA